MSEENVIQLDLGTTAQKTTAAEKLPVVLLALDQGKYDMPRSLDELRALADANGMQAVAQVVQKRQTPEAATLLGEGKVAEARLVCQNVRAAAAIFDGELTGGLQQYGHTTGAVVGSVYRLLVLRFIRILVGPGTGVVMCKKQQPCRFLFRIEAGEDVARMQHSAIESRGVKTLFMYLRSAAFQFRH